MTPKLQELLPRLHVKIYSESEVKSIAEELSRFMFAKQESIKDETVKEWIRSFAEMQIPAGEVVMRIRVAKLSKRYGTLTEFGDFMGISLSELESKYFSLYKHELPKYVWWYIKCNVCNRISTTRTVNDKTPQVNCCGEVMVWERVEE